MRPVLKLKEIYQEITRNEKTVKYNLELTGCFFVYLLVARIGSVLADTGLGTPPPLKKLQIEFTKEAVYRMSHREARLGGWGSEGPTFGRHVSMCATMIRLCALLYLHASH